MGNQIWMVGAVKVVLYSIWGSGGYGHQKSLDFGGSEICGHILSYFTVLLQIKLSSYT